MKVTLRAQRESSQILQQVIALGVNHGALRLLPLLTKIQSELFQISFVKWDTIFR